MNKIKTYIRAGYSALQCVTHEEDRVIAEICTAAKDINGVEYNLWSWSITSGLSNICTEEIVKGTADPIAMLNALYEFEITGDEPAPHGTKIPNKSIIILRDFHALLRNPNVLVVRRLKECISVGRATQRHIIIVGCQLHLPPELEKEITAIEYGLPSKADLLVVAKQLAADAKQELNGETERILDAGSGLTTTEFADAAAKSIIERGCIDPVLISDSKAEAIRKGGILEIVKPGVTFEQLGGLSDLKAWVSKRKHAFSDKAKEWGLPTPRGVCMFGVQGGGKSVATRAIASELNCPLIRLDAGKLFGGIVGSSEANVRNVIQQVEAFGKSVLQIDEIDKGFAGMTGGHDGDSGTTRRVIGTFLTWMSEKTAPVFIVATANDLTKLPPELLRKGRWDELFFIDLPSHAERVEIWAVQIRRNKRNPDDFNLSALASATDQWTGAEIEALYNEGLYAAWDAQCEPNTELLLALSKGTQPLSTTMAEQVSSLRSWAKGRAKYASPQDNKLSVPMKRKLQ